MSHEAILAAIPHREPFLLVDEIVARDGDTIECTKTFSGREEFFAGHYPGFPLVPGVYLLEAAMQAGAILLAPHFREAADKVPVATRIDRVKFRQMVRPGDTLRMKVTLVERLADAFFLKARVEVEGRVAARFEFACTAAAPGDVP